MHTHWSIADDELFAPIVLPQTLPSRREIWTLAYRAALRGVGSVKSSPLVGAVAVDAKGCVLGVAGHQRWGEGHAEANLIAQLQADGLMSRLANGTIYTTLEPCAHYGKTPPCAQLLASLPLAGVYFAVRDPNPLVEGKGQAEIRAAGIPCEQASDWAGIGMLRLHERSSCFTTTGLPFIGLKAAMTLDGATARPGDRRHMITGLRAREYGHWLRRVYDAVMVGAETVLADDPRLDGRHPDVPCMPQRLVLDPDGRALSKAATLQLVQLSPATTVWFVSPATHEHAPQAIAALRDAGVRVVPVPVDAAGFNLPELLSAIAAQRISSVLLEGGAHLWGSFLQAGLVRRLHLFQAPVLWGQHGVTHWTSSLALADEMRLDDISFTPLRDDWLLEAAITAQPPA